MDYSGDLIFLEDKDHNTVAEKDYDDHISHMKENSKQKSKLQQLTEHYETQFAKNEREFASRMGRNPRGVDNSFINTT